MSRGVLALVALWLAVPLAAAQSVELEGTWYVLVHYKDDHAVNADEQRWEDRVWVFAQDGRRLRWTEYPIVVFDDESGRFERRESGQYARILHFWEPNAAQQADIRDGLRVNTRGSKTKTLRGSDAKGWSSEQRAAAASASIVTYTEVWAVEGLASQPIFSRTDLLGGGRTDSLEGVTRYATTEVRDGGERLLGTFERDGSRHGTFEMRRSAPVGALEEKTLEQRQRDALRQVGSDPAAREATKALIDEQLRAVGVMVSPADLDALTATALRLAAQGVDPDGIRAALAQDLRGMLRGTGAEGARHDDAARYGWPFESATLHRLLSADDVLIFSVPLGTPVVAARDGVVTRVVDGHKEGESEGKAWKTNSVYVRHADGTFAVYAFLKLGIPVKLGQSVKTGDELGSVGATVIVGPQTLAFGVLRLDGEGRSQPVPIRFVAADPAGVVPEPGKSYGGR